MDIIRSKKETIKHRKVARQTQTKNNLIFEKKTQPKKKEKTTKNITQIVSTKQDLSKSSMKSYSHSWPNPPERTS